jgi:hypothetical protein
MDGALLPPILADLDVHEQYKITHAPSVFRTFSCGIQAEYRNGFSRFIVVGKTALAQNGKCFDVYRREKAAHLGRSECWRINAGVCTCPQYTAFSEWTLVLSAIAPRFPRT